jgi:hypothetical protein
VTSKKSIEVNGLSLMNTEGILIVISALCEMAVVQVGGSLCRGLGVVPLKVNVILHAIEAAEYLGKNRV